MEMKEDFEINGPTILAIGRQGYGLGSGDSECQASSSHLPVPDCSGSNVSAKKSRTDDGNFWHRENDAWRSLSGEFSQPQALADSQSVQRQNSITSSQGCWDFTFCNVNNLDEPGPGLGSTSMGSDINLGQSSRQGLFGHCEEKEPGTGNTGFDFLQTGADVAASSSSSSFLSSWRAGNGYGEVNYSTEGASIRDKGRSWNGVIESHPVGIGVTDLNTRMACSADGSGADGKGTANLMLNFLVQSPDSITGKEFTLNYHNRECLNEKVEDRGCTSQAENVYSRAGIGAQRSVDPSIRSHSWILPEDEGGRASFQRGNLASSLADTSGNVRPGHVISGRRRSSKRKISTFGLADASSFRAQACSKRGGCSTRIDGGTGPSRPDPKALGGTAIPGVCVSTSANSMHQTGEDHGIGTTGFMGSEGDLFESLRGNAREVSILDGTGGSSQSMDLAQFVGMQNEQSHSQLHSLFARNLRRSMPTAQSQAFSRRVSSNVQLGDLGRNTANNSGQLHESDQGPLAFGQRTSTSSADASWPGNNSLLRGSVLFPSSGAPVRENTSSTFERSRIRTMSGRAAAALESRLAHQASTSRGVTSRATNPSEATAQTNQLANSLLYPSGASSSHLSVLLSNRHYSRGIDRNMPPPPLASTATNHPASFGTSVEVIPPHAGMHGAPSRPITRPSLFLGGQGENLMAAPVQSMFGMPFCGLRLPAGGERRQRFVSEILSALEHARRSAELSFEELMMLDPSLVYGGIDIQDDHSDMRLDVDNMSYEELLALEERIGNVSTGLSDETISKCLRESKYSSLDATVAALSQDCDLKCCICQEEYMEEDELGILDCGHGYHTVCVKQWLLQKNWCPICKSTAYSKS